MGHTFVYLDGLFVFTDLLLLLSGLATLSRFRLCMNVCSFRESGGFSSVVEREDESAVVEEEGVMLPSQSESDEL